MSLHLLVTSGQGPGECRQAVAHVLRRMAEEAEAIGLDLDIAAREARHGPASALVAVHGDSGNFVKSWSGTIQWTAQSSLRPTHKRKNWFIGVFQIDGPKAVTALDPADLRFETCRAGGPGGQHVNTTDSAVRVVHGPSGLSALARDGRSQIQNRKLAIARLEALLDLQAQMQRAIDSRQENLLHYALERGNPVRRFKGAGFREVK